MSDQTAAPPEDPNELVTLQHDGIEGTIQRKRKALKHMAEGWKIVTDEVATSETPTDTVPKPVPYPKRKKPDLEALVARRNEGRAPEDHINVEGDGTVADLAAALTADDAAHPDQEN